MTMIMFGESHLESQRRLSLSTSPDVLGLLSTHRAHSHGMHPCTYQPGCLGTHISYPRLTLISLFLTDHRGEGVGWQSLPFIDQEVKVLKQACLRKIFPDILTISNWNFWLQT